MLPVHGEYSSPYDGASPKLFGLLSSSIQYLAAPAASLSVSQLPQGSFRFAVYAIPPIAQGVDWNALSGQLIEDYDEAWRRLANL